MVNNIIMKKINFISAWNKNRKFTWSGINYGLFMSLQKHFVVNDIDISVVNRGFYYRLKKKIKKICHLNFEDLHIEHTRLATKYVNKINTDSNIYFQFAEVKWDNAEKNIKTYIFQDQSVDQLAYMAHHQQEMFKMCNYRNVPIRMIDKRKTIQNAYYKNCAGVFTLARWIAEDLIVRTGLPKEKVHYAGSGVNVAVEKIDYSKKEGNKICFVGRDFLRKGGFVVVDAFKELKKKMPNAELYVAGPTTNPIVDIIPGYHFLGPQNSEQLSELYNICDIFAMPSYFEAFGIVFVEALTYGLPCIGRNRQDMPSIIDHGKTGFVIEDDNPQTLANYYYELLTDSKYSEKVRAQKDWYIKEYSWDNVADRIAEIINAENP